MTSHLDELLEFRYIPYMKKIWDKLGILFSSACIVHCILVAFLPVLFPAFSIYTEASWIHMSVAVIILATSPLAFIPGYKKHGLTWIIFLALSGLTFVLLALFLEGFTSDQVSHSISILGSMTLVFAHAKNLQHSRRHNHNCC